MENADILYNDRSIHKKDCNLTKKEKDKNLDIIVFEENPKDKFFRKSVEFASADVVLKEDNKASGNVERLSATVLKGVQDQLFSIARQKRIELGSKDLAEQLSAEYRDKFIEAQTKKAKKSNPSLSADEATASAEKSYQLQKRNLDRLAEKEAWRTTIRNEVKEDELIFRFDAKSILDYAKVNGAKKDRMQQDVLKVQERFNRWTEKRFDLTTGQVVDYDVSGVLFPYSVYRRGPNPMIEIKLEKELLHCVLFLNKNFLKYHLESYIRIETPNAIRLYELLIDYTHGNLFVSGRDLTFEYLQQKFNTKYKHFRQFLDSVVKVSLEKINDSLGTNIGWEAAKKNGKMIYSIKFIVSERDKKILQGIQNDDLDEALTLSFEFYLALVSLGGQKAQGGLKALYDATRAHMAEENFDYFGMSKEEAYENYKKNLTDAQKLETLIEDDENLTALYIYDRNYLNAISKESLHFVAPTASESLEHIRETYLIPRGLISPPLPFFTSYADEKSKMEAIFPFVLKITEKREITIDKESFESFKSTIMIYVEGGDIDKFQFKSEDAKKDFCNIFNVVYTPTAIDAKVVEMSKEGSGNRDIETHFTEKKSADHGEYTYQFTMEITGVFGRINNRITDNKWDEWETAVEQILDTFTPKEVSETIEYMRVGGKDVMFFMGHITGPEKFVEYFPKIDHQRKVFEASIRTNY